MGVPRSRMEIIRALSASKCSVTELMNATGLSRNGVRRHLEPMRDAGLIDEEERPPRYRSIRVYALNLGSLENAVWEMLERVTLDAGTPR